MKFNLYFELIDDFTEMDSDNYNDAEIEMIEDIDFGPSLSYTLDSTKVNDESYIEEIEEFMESSNIKDYKIEENVLIFTIS